MSEGPRAGSTINVEVHVSRFRFPKRFPLTRNLLLKIIDTLELGYRHYKGKGNSCCSKFGAISKSILLSVVAVFLCIPFVLVVSPLVMIYKMIGTADTLLEESDLYEREWFRIDRSSWCLFCSCDNIWRRIQKKRGLLLVGFLRRDIGQKTRILWCDPPRRLFFSNTNNNSNLLLTTISYNVPQHRYRNSYYCIRYLPDASPEVSLKQKLQCDCEQPFIFLFVILPSFIWSRQFDKKLCIHELRPHHTDCY
jgi:hypothetical protein